jgi:gliding motility-associated-like protein
LTLLLAAVLCAWGPKAAAQVEFGTGDPSEPMHCGEYLWPLVSSPCPEVQIKQKHDHTPKHAYMERGWDTVVTCTQQTLELSCTPYLPVQFFNGQYTVDTIPFDPPDPTFARGTKMPIATDDDFAGQATQIPFPFYFFGYEKNAFVLGANGLISFNLNNVANYCPWEYSASLPWTTGKTGVPNSVFCPTARMRDAIYGVYEDTQPQAAYLHGDQGIYYGIQDEEPCRKIICSWNGIPQFPARQNTDNRCTYQIVCYEGSNIIEVHVKRRGAANRTNNKGLIGIQNSTSLPQVQGNPMDSPSTMFVQPGSWPAFFPSGTNTFTSQLDTIAFRFTPQGPTNSSYKWYRIFDDGRDSIDLSSDPTDTNGYFFPMGHVDTCPTLTRAIVHPTEVSRYVFELRYIDAKGQSHNLYDTITIGMDTAGRYIMRPQGGSTGERQLDVCTPGPARIMMEYPSVQDTVHTTRIISRLNHGQEAVLDSSQLVLGQLYDDTEKKRIPMLLYADSIGAHLQPGHIDSVNIQFTADFASGCGSTVNFLVRFFPSYDTTIVASICDGETYHWTTNGQNYTQTTNSPRVDLTTQTGCDSTVRLDLTVYSTSHSVEHRNDCKPLLWHNGHLYTHNNTDTYESDTVVLKNVAGCDSVVQLDFVIHPMTPKIKSSLKYFDYDHLDVVLEDRSVGGESRVWRFPQGSNQYAKTAYWTLPIDMQAHDTVDGARIWLVETSQYGCVDSTSVLLPFHKETFWMPNAFTPDNPTGNNTFGSKSLNTVKQEMIVYDRRGDLVFKCDGVDCTWNGTDLNGNPMPMGTYVYIVRYTTKDEPDVTQVKRGSVTLIR